MASERLIFAEAKIFRSLLNNFRFCFLCCTNGALLNHRSPRSPFPAGECKRVSAIIQLAQRILLKFIILHSKLEDFYSNNFAKPPPRVRNYLNKNIPICFKTVKLKRCSLNCEEVWDNHFTFPSGEGGPRAVVVEESKVCTALSTSAPIY